MGVAQGPPLRIRGERSSQPLTCSSNYSSVDRKTREVRKSRPVVNDSNGHFLQVLCAATLSAGPAGYRSATGSVFLRATASGAVEPPQSGPVLNPGRHRPDDFSGTRRAAFRDLRRL